MQRDIAMLGVLYRAALGEGPPQLGQLSHRRVGSFMLQGPHNAATIHPMIKRSAQGLILVYKKLGSGVRSIAGVRHFWHNLQERVKVLIKKGVLDQWDCFYSPR